MKNFFLLITLTINLSFLFSQTLFTYGKNAISKDEFLRAYNKNKTTTIDKEKSMREYIDLYANFKLKVKAAQDIKLDTLPQQKADVQNFRNQIIENYMTNEAVLNNLIEEAIEHSKKDLHVIHFFTPLDTKRGSIDSVKAIKAMDEIYQGLIAGNNDYNALATSVSAKYVVVKPTDIGFVTAFTLPYEYEKIIYSLKNNATSKPYKSKNGLHIFKIIAERKSVGKWKVAQILFAMPPDIDDASKKLMKQKADSIYALLQAKANFAELAKNYSDDKFTYLSEGELPEFTTGKYDIPFEQEVFKLTKDGEITKPFLTQYGYHIIKRLAVHMLPENNDDANYRYEIKQKILQDKRADFAKDSFNKQIIQQIGYKKNLSIKETDLYKYADSIVANPAINSQKEFAISNKIIYANTDNKIYGKEWLDFVRQYKTNPEIYKDETNSVLVDKFLLLKSIAYYRDHLEKYNPNFKNQMDEFKEGNLLFEIMDRKVWNISNKDSAGIEKYYTQNKNKYQWASSADIVIFICSNKKIAEEAFSQAQNNKDWKKIAEQSNGTIQADSGRYELAQITLPSNNTAKEGLITPITVNLSDGSAGFIKILNLHPLKEQRTLEEARGLVINDYQSVIEQQWLQELKNKYPIKIDEKVFKQLLQ